MKDQKRQHRKPKQLSNTDRHKKEANNCTSGGTKMFRTLKDGPSYSKMSKNDTHVANSSPSDHLTLYEMHVLEQKKSLQTNKMDNFGSIADVTTCEPNQLTLHELFERQGYTWNSREPALAQEEHFTHSDNKESAKYSNDHLTLYEIYQMKGLECNNERKHITQREFIPHPANKEFFIQCRNKRMEKVPEWIKAIWRKQSNEQKCEESKIARISEKKNMEDDEQADSGFHGCQQNNVEHASFHLAADYSQVYFQGSLNKIGNLSKYMQQSCDNHQTTSISPIYKVLEKSPESTVKENRVRGDASPDFNAIEAVEFSEEHENWLEKEAVLSSTSDDMPLSQVLGKEKEEQNLLQRKNHEVEDEYSKRFGGQITEAASVVQEKTFNGSMDQEHPTVQEWKEWSIKQLKDGQLCITGKYNGVSSVSEDVSCWKRIDARTLKNCKESIVYKLIGIPDHCVGIDFPSFVRKKFQNGFPEDWLEVLKLWNEMQHKGDSTQNTDQWLESNRSSACAPSVQKYSACLSASKMESQKMLKNAKMVMRKLELDQLGNSSFRTSEERSKTIYDIQPHQPKLSNERDGIRGTTFPQQERASNQLEFTVTLRKVPDIQSSFDETDTSFFSQ